MRITTHIPDQIAKDVKMIAQNEKKSVSSLIAEALRYYLTERKKRRFGRKVLELAGKVKVSVQTERELEEGRKDWNDRA